MKTFTLNKTWHLWLANFAEKRIYPEDGTDICTYTRAVLKGLFWATLAGLFWLGVAGMVFGTIHNIFDMIFFDGTLQLQTVIVGGLIAAVAVLAGLYHLKEWWDNRPVEEKPERDPTFVELAYIKVKNKTCFRLEFK